MKKILLALMMVPLFSQAQIFSEDFESGLPDSWTQEGDPWIAESSAWGVDLASTGVVFDDDALGETGVGNTGTLYSPVIDLTNYTNITLSFDHFNVKYELESSLNVEVFDGTNWVNVVSDSGFFTDDPNVAVPIPESIDVTAYANPAFQVRFIYNDGGDWSYGAVADNFVVDGTLANPAVTASTASIYPNPARGQFNVSLGNNFDVASLQVTVSDLSGKTVKTFTGTQSFNIADLTAGMYMVQVTDGHIIDNQKLIVR